MLLVDGIRVMLQNALSLVIFVRNLSIKDVISITIYVCIPENARFHVMCVRNPLVIDVVLADTYVCILGSCPIHVRYARNVLVNLVM
jgi:hypothetical protein